MPETDEDTDLIRIVLEDHRRFRAVFDELESGTGNGACKDLVDHLIAELVRHAVAEEQFLYPAARKELDDGDDIVDHEIEEHAECEELMKRLEGLGPDDEDFEPLVGELIESVRHHLEEEEDELLPRMREACDAEELQDLGFKVLAAKEFAPTRPHPHSPRTSPANLVVGPGVGLVDKIRDTLSGRDV